MNTPKVRGRFSPVDAAAQRRGKDEKGIDIPSKTQKQFAVDADVNTMVQRFRGPPPGLPNASKRPIFGDFANVPDYMSAFNAVSRVQEQYMGLPSSIRKRFTSPARIIEFISDPENKAEAEKLGLLPKPPVQPPTPPAQAGSTAEAGNAGGQPPAPKVPTQGGLPVGDQ